jgi:5-methylcytosine-specific restriction endonuclease McrA
VSDIEQFDVSKFYLGVLCKREHDYNSTQQSLRRKCNAKCVGCEQAYAKENAEKLRSYIKKYRQENKAALKKQQKEWYEANKEYANERDRKYRQEHKQEDAERSRRYRQRNKEKVRERARNRYKNDRERRREIVRRWRSKNLHLIRLYSNKRRALKKKNGCIPYSVQELNIRFNEFDNCCAYCGTSENLTIDHVVAIAKGGVDALSNIVPCCLSCNSGKFSHDVYEWYSLKPFFSIERWERIRAIINL